MPHLSCRYYEFDSVFAREVLGKKLSKGTKKDLDDISSKTGIALKSCRRQVLLTLWPLVFLNVSLGKDEYCMISNAILQKCCHCTILII